MCEGCVKQEFPDRGRICLDSGTYMANFRSCCQCTSMNVVIVNKTSTMDGDTENIVYDHQCEDCSHVIAQHRHTFCIEGDYQEYEMECLLCGVADDSISIMPDDPRKALDLF